MTREEAKTKLVNEIEYMGGCKATELPVRFYHREYEGELFEHPLPDLLEELTDEGRVVTIEYCLPEMPDRLKSFYLPPGTKLNRIVGHV